MPGARVRKGDFAIKTQSPCPGRQHYLSLSRKLDKITKGAIVDEKNRSQGPIHLIDLFNLQDNLMKSVITATLALHLRKSKSRDVKIIEQPGQEHTCLSRYQHFKLACRDQNPSSLAPESVLLNITQYCYLFPRGIV